MTSRRGAGDDEGLPEGRVRVRPAALRKNRPREWLTRFGFGSGVSLVAGVVAVIAGPRLGGVFLAFPAILLASLTLVAEEEGLRQAREDARGATFGTIGLIVFAAVVATVVGWCSWWLVLVVASLGWTLASLGTYLIARLIAGGHKPSAR